MRYTIAIKKNEENEDKKYSASVVELPYCKTGGDTIEDCLNGIRKVIKNYQDNINDETIVFTLKSSEANFHKNADYYYTLDDDRDNKAYWAWRAAFILFCLGVIYIASCFILVNPLFPISCFAEKVKCEETSIPNLIIIISVIGTIISTIWALLSYWRLIYIDKQAEKWRPHEQIDEWSNPFTFHVLAESHKQWAELWFSWCVAIFTGGVTYAIYNIHAHTPMLAKDVMDWQHVVYNIINTQAPSGFIYILFGVAWYWASKHYKSHWHNFVINAYRHRALYRFKELRDDVLKLKSNCTVECDITKANETLLELYRLSGVLLLIPGDSSYLDKLGSEEMTKSFLQMQELVSGVSGMQHNK